MSNPYSRDAMLARYWALCDQRDAINASVADQQAAREAAVAEEQAARERAMRATAAINAARGGDAWLTLKREIATLANALQKIPPRAA